MERNEKNTSTIRRDFQPTGESFHSRACNPLKAALVQISQAKLLLRRARAESIKSDQRERLNRTLDQISESIKWLELLDGGGFKDADLTSAGALL